MPRREMPPGPLRDELEELLAKHKREEALRKEAESNAAQLATEWPELEDELERGNQTIKLANVLTKHLLSSQELEEKRRKEAEKQAQTDPLTKLPNRRAFEESIIRLKRSADKGAVLILDVDDFKVYNDTYGHLIGDRVLLTVAEYLKTHSRTDDILARWAGDEFIIYFHGATAEAVMDKFKLPEELATQDKQCGIVIPLTVELTEGGQTKTTQLIITLSGGVVDYNPSREDFGSAFEKADEALYAAKEAGRGHFRIYRPQIRELKQPKRRAV